MIQSLFKGQDTGDAVERHDGHPGCVSSRRGDAPTQALVALNGLATMGLEMAD
jgi:hypothetical protein